MPTNDINLLRYIIDECNIKPDLTTLENAILWKCNLDILHLIIKELKSLNIYFGIDILDNISSVTDINIFKLILEECKKENVKPTINTLSKYILLNKNIDIIDIIIQECSKYNIKPNIELLDYAINRNKNLKLVKLILNTGLKPNINILNDAINKNVNIDIILLLLETGIKPTIETLNYSINNNKNITIISLIIENGIIPTIESLNYAIDKKDINIITLILEECIKNNVKLDIITLEKSIKNNINIDFIKLILEQCKKINIKPDIELLNYVIRYNTNNINLINLLINEGGVKPNLKSLDFSISGKNKNVVSLIIQCGVKPTIETLNLFAIYYEDIVKLILEECKKINIYPTLETLNISMKTNNINIITLIIEECKKIHIYPTLETLNLSIKTNYINIITLIIEECKNININPTLETLNISIKTNNIKIVNLIIEECKKVDIVPTIDTLNIAIYVPKIDLDIIKLIIDSGKLKIDKNIFMKIFYPKEKIDDITINPLIKNYIKDQMFCSNTITQLDFKISNEKINIDNNIIDSVTYIKYDDCELFLNKPCPINFKSFNFSNDNIPNTNTNTCCYKDFNDEDVINFKKLNSTDIYKYINILLSSLSDDNLNNYIYSVIIYSHNGDVLLNKYYLNNNKINNNIIDYYQSHYLSGFLKYEKNISCIKEHSVEFIKCYIESIHNDINNIFENIKLPNLVLNVFRGFDMNEDTFNEKYKVNNLIQFNTFLSTSLYIDVAEGFANPKVSGNVSIIFDIILPLGSKYIPILGYSVYDLENEILLNKGTKLYIKNIEKVKSVYFVKCVYV